MGQYILDSRNTVLARRSLQGGMFRGTSGLMGYGSMGAIVVGNVAIDGGDGTKGSPFGGIGGAPETVLAALVKAGIGFNAPPTGGDPMIQTGLLNREKYIYVVGTDKNFYKFKVTGTGVGAESSDDQARTWFASAIQSAKLGGGTATAAGGGLKVTFKPGALTPGGLNPSLFPKTSPTFGVQSVPTGGLSTTTIMLAGGAALLLLLAMRK